MKIVSKISIKELQVMAEAMYGIFVKADVDIAQKKMIVDMEMHADGEAELLNQGSKQDDLWGINLYPAKFGTNEFIEFDSMINVSSRRGNPSRSVLDPKVRQQIAAIVREVVHE